MAKHTTVNTTTHQERGARLASKASSAIVLLSKKGMRELQKAIAQLDHERRELIRSLHDMTKSTNHDDRFLQVERLARLETIESQLEEKRHIASAAQFIPTRRARLKVAIGSVVDLIDQQGRLFRYTLVDSIEANPSDGRISIVSPLGRELVGKTVKDVVEWGNGLRRQTFQLVHIT